ncbi:MAG: nuclear transport factor 2 family protein [Pseudoprimorskyibacter sp.]|nr:nuclear transport factor 2 family protein [Pseudoprimorskyibacter sp.]
MDKEDVQNWLDAYGVAWVKGEPEEIVPLFAQTVSYREKPFDDAMVGREAIKQYWQEGAADAQENLEFSSQVWAVDEQTAVAGWQAKFTRKSSGVRVELDGTFRLKFSTASGQLLCESLEEWWHRREI